MFQPFLKPTIGEQEIIRTLLNDNDIRLGPHPDVRRTASRVCLTVEHGDYNDTDLFGAAIGVEPERATEAGGSIWFAYSPAGARVTSVNI